MDSNNQPSQGPAEGTVEGIAGAGQAVHAATTPVPVDSHATDHAAPASHAAASHATAGAHPHHHAAVTKDEVTAEEHWPLERDGELATSGRLDRHSQHLAAIQEDHVVKSSEEVTREESWPVESDGALASFGRVDRQALHIPEAILESESAGPDSPAVPTEAGEETAPSEGHAQPADGAQQQGSWSRSLRDALSHDSPGGSHTSSAAAADSVEPAGASGRARRDRSSSPGPGAQAAAAAAVLAASDPQSHVQPQPHQIQPARTSAAKVPFLQRLSFGGAPKQTPAAADAARRRSFASEPPSADGAAVPSDVPPEGSGPSPSQRTSGGWLSRVSQSFKGSIGGGAGPSGGSTSEAGAQPSERSSQPLPGKKTNNTSRELRPLGASSVPVVQAYSELATHGPPNLRRRGCYAGLVGSYRQGQAMPTVMEGVPSDVSGGSTLTAADEKQLEELKSWLQDTTTPWKRHSSKLHHLQAVELMEEQRKAAEEPKVVLPQAPSKPKLKTFSMAPNSMKRS